MARAFARGLAPLLLSTLLLATPFALASNVGKAVADIALQDQSGALRKPLAQADVSAVVLMTQGNGCPIVRNAMPALHDLAERFGSRGVAFYLLNANLQDDAASVANEAEVFGYQLPVLIDTDQRVAAALGVRRTAEVYLIEVASRQVLYHGPIDDRLTYQTQKGAARHHYLADAISATLAGEEVPVAEVDAPGCLITFAEP